MTEIVKYTSHYRVARIVAALISVSGWLVVTVSVVVAVTAAISSIKFGYKFASLSALPGLIGVLSGLFMIAMGQLTRATLDSADYSGEMLAIMKKVHGEQEDAHNR